MGRRGTSTFFMWVLALAALRVASGNAAELPLADIVKNMPDADEAAVRSEALAQVTNCPLYLSQQLEQQTFLGTFVPTSSDTKVAVFSDDGATVSVRLVGGEWQQVLSRKAQGQHLPRIDDSFHVLEYTWLAGQEYEVKVEYSSVIYRGTQDIDGITFFAYNGGGEAIEVQVTAHRAGSKWGETVPEDIENEGTPAKFVVLTNNDHDQAWHVDRACQPRRGIQGMFEEDWRLM